MPLSITYSTGQNCSLPDGGCVVLLYPNTVSSLVSTDRYFLLGGIANVTYGNNAAVTISSPYSGSDWQSYVDDWTYGVDAQIATNPTTRFLQVFANNSTISNVNVTTIDNSAVDVSIKPNSSVLVVGSTFSVDGTAYSDRPPVTILRYTEEKVVNISTRDICKVVHIEEA